MKSSANSPHSFLHFASLCHVPHLQHSVTTRGGGTSEGPYASLNLGYHVGDDAARVTENRRYLAAALGYDADSVVAAQQVHGAQSHVVTADMRGRGALDWHSAPPSTDALIVQERQLPVMILVADCSPLLLVDPVQRVLAVVHAGWRGAVAGITSLTVERMQRDFSSSPSEILAGIGPCLCAACFEIGPEVAEAAAIIAPEAVQQGQAKPHLDLRALTHSDLQRAGVLEPHIETMLHCPRCEPETFFSHRGQNGVAGRFGLVAWWQ